MADRQTYRFKYQPAASGRCGSLRSYTYYGTWDEATAHFLANHVCDACKEEMAGGEVEYVVVHADGREERETRDTAPHDNPWATSCGAEWDYEVERDASAEPAVWVAADALNSPHPTCISSLAYMSQLDRERGREYVPLYAAPVADTWHAPVDEYDPAPPGDDEIAEAYRLKYEEE